MKEKLCFYKIVDTATGKFSSGGRNPTFNKKGKVWTNIGHVKAHLKDYKTTPATKVVVSSNFFSPIPTAMPAVPQERSIPQTWVVQEYIYKKEAENVVPISELILAMGLF